jgi:hypothetical protein
MTACTGAPRRGRADRYRRRNGRQAAAASRRLPSRHRRRSQVRRALRDLADGWAGRRTRPAARPTAASTGRPRRCEPPRFAVVGGAVAVANEVSSPFCARRRSTTPQPAFQPTSTSATGRRWQTWSTPSCWRRLTSRTRPWRAGHFVGDYQGLTAIGRAVCSHSSALRATPQQRGRRPIRLTR